MSESQGLPFPRRIVAVFALCSGGLTLMIDASIANIVLPTLAQDLQVKSSEAVMVVTAYQLILAMTLMPLAALGERIGHRRLYCAGLIIHSLAALLCLQADSLPLLIAARALQAVGTASAMSVAFGLIRAVYPPHQLGKGMAINTIANASGTALAPVVGGLVLTFASWHWVFAAAVPFSLVTLLFSRYLPAPEPQPHPFDRRGALLCAITFGLVIGGLEMTSGGPGLPLALLVLAVGIGAAWLFVKHELQQEHPVLPVDLLTQPPLALALISNFATVLGSMTLLIFLPFLLQHRFGYSPAAVGGLLAFYALASVMIAPTSGYLSDRIPVAILCTAGMAVAATGLILLALLPEAPSRVDIAWRLWVCGAGFGMFFSPNARLVIGSAPMRRAASAGSMVTTSRMLGQATGATLVAGLLALGLGDGNAPIFCALALILTSGSICVVRLLGERRQNTASAG
ncbi:MFS transporter [Halioxenophilus sp. WMMB6]|uniref:MFS transporter n=1 Tax=Halioxenophilus sp. WMMB6 TaxID=3073815 RepID=UPI00295F0C21|nr:MFS transporter [Halioxenophilus sp. WMMB6]